VDCSTRFPDRVELARQAAEEHGYGLVIRVVRDGVRAPGWSARLVARNGSGPPLEAAGPTAEDAAEAALLLLNGLPAAAPTQTG
jgi:hypothetical protein